MHNKYTLTHMNVELRFDTKCGHILEVVRKIKKTPTPKRQETGEVKTPPHPHQKPKNLQN